MQRAEAVRRLSKMIGKGFAYEIKPNAPTPEEREAAKARHPALVAERERLGKALDARRRELQDADAEYQRILGELKTARAAVDKNNGPIHIYKFTVGTANNLFFHVKAQGDSWEEIFAKLAKENKSK